MFGHDVKRKEGTGNICRFKLPRMYVPLFCSHRNTSHLPSDPTTINTAVHWFIQDLIRYVTHQSMRSCIMYKIVPSDPPCLEHVRVPHEPSKRRPKDTPRTQIFHYIQVVVPSHGRLLCTRHNISSCLSEQVMLHTYHTPSTINSVPW